MPPSPPVCPCQTVRISGASWSGIRCPNLRSRFATEARFVLRPACAGRSCGHILGLTYGCQLLCTHAFQRAGMNTPAVRVAPPRCTDADFVASPTAWACAGSLAVPKPSEQRWRRMHRDPAYARVGRGAIGNGGNRNANGPARAGSLHKTTNNYIGGIMPCLPCSLSHSLHWSIPMPWSALQSLQEAPLRFIHTPVSDHLPEPLNANESAEIA